MSVRRRHLLRRPQVAHFLAWLALGQIADVAVALGLTQALVAQLEPDGTPAALAGVLAVASLPFALGPLAGIAADHWDRRHLLVLANLVRGGASTLAVVAVIVEQRSLGYLSVAVLLGAARLVYTIRGSALPHLVARRELVVGESLVLVVGMAAGAVGGVGAGLAVRWSPEAVLVVSALLYLAAAAGFARARSDLGGGDGVRADGAGVAEMAQRVLRSLSERSTRLAVSLTSTHRALLGTGFAAFVLVADARLDVDATGYAAAVALVAGGAVTGTVTAPWVLGRLGRSGLAVASLALAGGALAAFAGTPRTVAIGAVAIGVVSFAFQNLRVVADATVQSVVADEVLARVFSVYDALYNLAFLGGALIGIAVHELVSPAAAFAATAGSYVLVALLHVAVARRRPW